MNEKFLILFVQVTKKLFLNYFNLYSNFISTVKKIFARISFPVGDLKLFFFFKAKCSTSFNCEKKKKNFYAYIFGVDGVGAFILIFKRGLLN